MIFSSILDYITYITEGYSQENIFWEIRLINKLNVKQFFFKNVEEIKEFLKNQENELKNYNCYIGIYPRIERKGDSSAVKFGNVLFFDFDSGKAKENIDIIYEKLCNLGLKPSLLGISGHGVHGYIKLNEVLDIEKLKEVENDFLLFLKANLGEYNPDMKINDPARIMRVLGTLNLKEEPIESKIIKKDLVKYSIKEIEEKIGEIILYEEKIIFNKNYSFFF
jgi:hypothetical protein